MATVKMFKNGTDFITTPFVIGIAGGTASGKTYVCKKIVEELGEADISAESRRVVSIGQDSFYRKLTPGESKEAAQGRFNFDHPSALDLPLLTNVLSDLMNNRRTEIPVYDFVTNSPKLDEFETIYPADNVLVEGILCFYFPQIRDLFQLKIFVDADSDVRLCRRIQRDVEERGRNVEQVLTQYMDTVKPAFEDFCLPTKKYADVIIPRGGQNKVAVELIVQHIKEVLAVRNELNGENGNNNSNGIHLNGFGNVNGNDADDDDDEKVHWNSARGRPH